MTHNPAMRATTGFPASLLLLCLLAGTPLQATDRVAHLPESLAGALRAIPEVNLDGLDAQARDTLIDARKRLHAALDNNAEPDELAAAYGELGGLYHVYNLFQSADDCYENAKQLDPDNFRWAYYSGYLAAQNGRTQLAITRLEKARTLKPGYQALTLRLADAWLDLNEQDKAQAAYQTLVNTSGLEAASWYGLGQIALLQRDYTAAIEYFTRALEYDPDASRIHYPLAQALRAVNRNAEAKSQLALRGDEMPAIRDPQIESLNAIKGGAVMHFLHAMRAIKQHDNPKARDAFAAGLALQPDNVRARISYARLLYLTGDKAGTRAALEAALAREADNSLGLFLLGVLTEEEGDAAQAADYYLRVLEHDPGHAGANFYLANDYYRKDLYQPAATLYAAAIQGDPGNMAAYMPYLGALQQTGATDAEIMPHLMAAIRQFPEHPVFQTLQVRLLATSADKHINNPQEALRIARQLVDQQPIPPHQEVLALAAAAAGDFDKATAVQEELVSFAVWSAPGGGIDLDRLNSTLSSYRDGKLPPRAVMAAWPVSPPPAFYGDAPFRNYPAAKPY